MRLDLADFLKIRDLIHAQTGIAFDENKLLFVKKRLQIRMEACRTETALEYLRLLKFGDPRGEELQAFINLLTTNETYFFREFNQLVVFAEQCLPELAARRASMKNRRLRLWSAGCSTGEEPYTLAIILREMLEEPDSWLLDVLATDIDTRVLNTARKGLYDRRAVKEMPPEYLDQWLTRTRTGQYRVHPILRHMCRFEHLNMHQDSQMARVVNVDFIFCRNVLIYFDDLARQKVVAHFFESLNPGGYIFLGHSESMSRISNAFRAIRRGGMILYQKPWL
ncbi:MAG: protein-glutamate O-methyltransferase CheR [Thermodesulfobacteriota bacterium]